MTTRPCVGSSNGVRAVSDWSYKLAITPSNYDEVKRRLKHLHFGKDYAFFYNLDEGCFNFYFKADIDAVTKGDLMLIKLIHG